MLPHDHKPWAKTLARIVICANYWPYLPGILPQRRNILHIPEIVGLFLLFLTIVPPNLAILYPWILPSHDQSNHRTTKSTVR